MIGLKLHTNGEIETYELSEEKETYIALQKAIGCNCIDIVHAVNLPEPYCLVVDDEGLLVDEPVINPVASYLYGMRDHGQPLCGDVLIMKDKYTDDGIETVGLEREDLVAVYSAVFSREAFIYTTALIAAIGEQGDEQD